VREIGELFLILFTASLVDWLVSFLQLPHIVAFGRPSGWDPDTRGREDGSAAFGRAKVFLFAIHNEERRTVSLRREPIEIQFEVEGEHGFDLLERGGFEAFLGPDHEVTAQWAIVGKRLRLLVHRLRPLKTYVFKCYVDPRAYRVKMTVFIPFSGVARRFFERVSRHLFGFTGVEHKRMELVVDTGEARRATKGTLTRSLGFVAPTFILCGFSYFLFRAWVLLPLITAYAHRVSADRAGWYLQESAWPFDLIMILLGIVLLAWLTESRGYGMAQGYHYWSVLPFEGSQSGSKREIDVEMD
jgi:hypothetical protein